MNGEEMQVIEDCIDKLINVLADAKTNDGRRRTRKSDLIVTEVVASLIRLRKNHKLKKNNHSKK